jgi:hypothetical protein
MVLYYQISYTTCGGHLCVLFRVRPSCHLSFRLLLWIPSSWLTNTWDHVEQSAHGFVQMGEVLAKP